MKKLLMTALLLLCAMFSTSLLFAQNPNPLSVCFTDDMGQTYHLSLYPGGQKGCHTSIGVVRLAKHRGNIADNMQDRCWAVIGSGCFLNENGLESGVVHFVAYNPARDNCASDPDSIVYDGNMVFTRSTGAISGSGTTADYCNGSVVSSGTWNATGPCDGMKPASKKSNGAFSFSVVPNPANSTTVIKYSLDKATLVNVVVYNYNNQPVKVLTNNIQQAGQCTASWNLMDAAGRKTTSGLYKVVITVDGKQYSQTLQVL